MEEGKGGVEVLYECWEGVKRREIDVDCLGDILEIVGENEGGEYVELNVGEKWGIREGEGKGELGMEILGVRMEERV